MKLFIALCVIFAVVAADWAPFERDQMLENRKECIKSEKVSEANVAKIRSGEYPDEESVRCYVRCTMKKTEIWDDTNGYNIERAQQQMEKLGNKISTEDFNKCFSKNTDNADSCTWAYKGLKCLYDNKFITVSPLKSS